MKTLRHEVAGQPVAIHVVETEEDLKGFRLELGYAAPWSGAVAVDSETTGLDIYADTFRLRLVQFGTASDAWVVPVEKGTLFQNAVRDALTYLPHLIFHNASYDLQVFDQTLKIPMSTLWPKVTDTKILSHLVDPRGPQDGGVGHSLEALTWEYIDEKVATEVKGSMSALARELRIPRAKLWSEIPIDHPGYNLYAGMDTILTRRLETLLHPQIPPSSVDLIQFEHQVAEVCAQMEETGFLLDTDYTWHLAERLEDMEEANIKLAQSFGCENVFSTEQVADVIEHRGTELTARTATGKRQVDKKVLGALLEAGDPFAYAVTEAKKARKWRTTWVEGFLRGRDSNGRCHAHINSLQARTARMSITGIPAQTLPSGDWMIRRCFVADAGERIASVDYRAQELRVLAALSKDSRMIRAFQEDQDLHLITARSAFGPDVTADGPERKYAKVVNFGRVYGGGAKVVAEQTGLDLATAQRVTKAFDDAYPDVKWYSRRLQKQAKEDGYITTPSGRMLPVDEGHEYAALNYMVQSTARDVTCRGLVRLHEAGLSSYVRLPVHDEVVLSVPQDLSDVAVQEVAHTMSERMGPVMVDTEWTLGKRSWGSLYSAEE